MKSFLILKFTLLLFIKVSFAQNGYVQKTFQLPMSNEAKPYFVKLVGTDYLLNGDIVVGNTLQHTRLYQTSDRNSFIWPKGNVPVEIDENIQQTSSVKDKSNMSLYDHVVRAISSLNSTNLRIVRHTNEKDYIRIKMVGPQDLGYNGGSSPVGKQGGEQVIKVTYDVTSRVIAHELLHSLGFWHEQSRYDRDNYIVIDTSNIEEKNRHNFQIEPGTPLGEYDYKSIMHYDAYGFAKDPEKPVIRCKNGNTISDCKFGPGPYLFSDADIKAINTAYYFNAGLAKAVYREYMVKPAGTAFQNSTGNQDRLTNVGVVPITTGWYKIKVNQTGKYLAIEGISMDNGARLVQWDFVDQGNHKFFVQELGGGDYQLSALHSNKYINVAGQSKADGSAVIQWDWANQDNVKWKIIYRAKNEGGLGGWEIKNKNSGSPLCLNNMFSKNNGEFFIVKNPVYEDGAYEPVQTFSFERITEQQPKLREEKLYEKSPGMLKQVKKN
ncbi:M12 family metallopeptidase [Ferruginibacter sp. HRS2-29]|uniref:M12 family metallopeptidase n=1 Tax=Ferruginibacter sp. HRS2-29 TaxID=2487334 RepID=UPI0020CD8806|nr:M12 family metallopeptidase [Ferruginibacter sp. HRS2-29]MCP9751809.1 hypothetical protein [Ferruginibacter sp. HRS2-29]